jgi:RHS repeat-associated protein
VRLDQKSGSLAEQRKYIGQEFDTSTNLSYLNARFYNPDRGQFLSEDPVFWEISQTQDGKAVLQNPQTQNSYSYAGDNPIVNKDQDGRKLFDTSYGFTAGPFGLNVGLRYEPGVGWQIYSSNSIGLGIGASVKYDPNGHLDQRVNRGDTYTQKEFVFAPVVGGYKSTTVKENPMDPFNFSNNPQISKGYAFGFEFGYTYSTEHEGNVNLFKPITNTSSSYTRTNNNPVNSTQSSQISTNNYASISSILSSIASILRGIQQQISQFGNSNKKN